MIGTISFPSRPTTFGFGILVLLMPSLVTSQTAVDNTLPALIKNLGSGDFKKRELAQTALKNRPEAISELRAVLPVVDNETRSRIVEILAYHDQRAVRDLFGRAKDGRADEFIRMAASFPSGKHDGEVWQAVREFCKTLKVRHDNSGGEKMKLITDYAEIPIHLSTNRLTETTNADKEGLYFVRAAEVDLDHTRRNKLEIINEIDAISVQVVSRSVYLLGSRSHIILAGGDVKLSGPDFDSVLIVSGGDVLLDGRFFTSLIIARGSISCSAKSEIAGCRLISGKAITLNRDWEPSIRNIITEKESNPLGFIRWADAPKEKLVPKAK